MILFASVGRQVQRGENCAEKEPRAELARYQIGMLALPPQPGGGGERLLHERCRIDEYLYGGARVREQPARHPLEPRLYDVVIVVALCIDRDGALRAPLQARERIVFTAIVDAEHDDGAHLRPQVARIGAACCGGLHPFHVAVGAFGQELPQPCGRERDGIGRGYSDGFEAFGPCRARQRRFQRSLLG